MLVLTNENKSFDLKLVGKVLKEEVGYSVLDYSDVDDVDYFWPPLVMLEEFNSVAVDLSIGNYRLQVPSEWSIVVGDPLTGDVEVVLIEELLLRDFQAFTINPLSGLMPGFEKIVIEDLFIDVCWTVPKLTNNHFLLIPLMPGKGSPCVLLINEKDQKKLTPIEVHDIV